MIESGERRRNYALRMRIDKLIGRVQAAREEIVERGLEAVHDNGEGTTPDDDSDRPPDAGAADRRA